MKCKLCGSENVKIIYHGFIRDGKVYSKTSEEVDIYRCDNCEVMWHNAGHDLGKYYESKDYRMELESTSDIEDFYKLHDFETLDKFRYTGTDCFRNKIVADIGCGGGAFLDFLKGVAMDIVAIEPSETYRNILDRKGFHTYSYLENAIVDYRESVDVIVSFDVIEHVENPKCFVKETYMLLKKGGKAIIGTPTDAPIMRRLLGEIYERKLLFSTQHLWIFSEKILKLLAEQEGFSNVKTKFYQRYSIGNLMGWLRDKEPRTEIRDEFITETLDNVWKSQCSEKGLADYIVLYLEK